MMMHDLLGRQVDPQSFDRAQLALIFPKNSLIAQRVFLILWENRGRFVPAKQILESVPPMSCGRGRTIHDLWRIIEFLQTVFRDKAWPINVSAVGNSFRFDLADEGFDWRSREYHDAAAFLMTFPTMQPSGAIVMGCLYRNAPGVVPYDEIASKIRAISGRRATTKQIIDVLIKARRTLRDENCAWAIGSTQGYGLILNLHNKTTEPCLKDLDIDPGCYSTKRLSLACRVLGDNFPSVAAAFLILWDKRNQTISHETLEEKYDQVSSGSATKVGFFFAVRGVRLAASERKLHFSIRSHRGIGYQLVDPSSRFRFSAADLQLRRETSFFDRRAQLATALPGMAAQALSVMQILRERRGTMMDRAMISGAYYRHTGVEISERGFNAAISRARRFLTAAGCPVKISRASLYDGYELLGDIDAWMLGTAQPMHRPLGISRSLVRKSASVPFYRNHFARSRGLEFMN